MTERGAEAVVQPGPVVSAAVPPEARGLSRDGVRLLVAGPAGMAHTRFRELPAHLRPGDLIVVNTSATLAAAIDGHRNGHPTTVHLSTALPDGTWAAELRPGRRASGPLYGVRPGDVVTLPGGRGHVVEPYPDRDASPTRLWRIRLIVPDAVPSYLATHGRPIAYDYVPDDWPLAIYQTVFGRDPGSAEMPSAARPFTDALVTELVTSGIAVAPITLHTGVSSLEADESPLPERYVVAETTARLVEHTRRSGGRVIAVGTTVTRALETVTSPDGTVSAGQGWTDLVLGPDRRARVVRGLVTGWHESGASHIRLLEAVAGQDLVASAYQAARSAGYLWHEFGDSALFLP